MSGKWTDSMLVKAFKLAGDGLDDGQIARALGTDAERFKKWKMQKPALREALAEAREKSHKGDGQRELLEMARGRMPKKARELWERLESLEVWLRPLGPGKDRPYRSRGDIDKERRALADAIDGGGKRLRQYLYLQALMASNFMHGVACRRVGIDPKEPKEWIAAEPAFAQVMRSIHEAKKDFLESALLDLVKAGDSAAIIFANRTINRDRGYAEKRELESFVNVKQEHTIKLEDLPLEAKRAMLEAIRAKREAPMLEDRTVQDAEIA